MASSTMAVVLHKAEVTEMGIVIQILLVISGYYFPVTSKALGGLINAYNVGIVHNNSIAGVRTRSPR